MYDVATAGPPQPSTADTDAIQLQPNVLYGVSTDPDRGDQTTYYVRTGIQTKNNLAYSFITADTSTATNTDAIQLNLNLVYGVNTEPDRGDQTTYYIRTGIQMEHNPVYSIATADTDTDTIQLQPNVLYAGRTEPDRGDQTTYYENEGVGTLTNGQNENYYTYVRL